VIRKLAPYIPLRLFITLIVIYMCVGMHLIHPSLHMHIENDTHSVYHPHTDPGEKLMMEKHHACSICDFFTVSQFFQPSLKPSSEGNQHHDQIVSANLQMIIKSYSNQIKSRASPYPSL